MTLQVPEVLARAGAIADFISDRRAAIIDALTTYETYQVALDELERTLDLPYSLHENEQYFQRQIRSVVTFLPRNQPLYSLSCFALVPALLAANVHVRPPAAIGIAVILFLLVNSMGVLILDWRVWGQHPTVWQWAGVSLALAVILCIELGKREVA